jgi:hypothetical protein
MEKLVDGDVEVIGAALNSHHPHAALPHSPADLHLLAA